MKKKMSIRQKLFKKLGAMPMIALSFVLVIVIGTILLSMPFTNVGSPKPLLDNLFVATSATCVTGLVPFVVVEQYNFWGQLVLIALMQIGGLGLMTLLGLILSLMKYKLFFAEKKMIQDVLSKGDLQDIPKFIKSIVKYTFIFEFTGFVLIATRFVPQFGWSQGIFKSIFLSISAFCNAGIDNLGATSLAAYASDPLINFVVGTLIITGGLGFIVWFELRTHAETLFRRKIKLKKAMKVLTVHTKFVLVVTLSLLLSGTVLIFLLEYNNPETLGQLPLGQKLMVSTFQSITLRTAGFSTLDIGLLNPATQFLFTIYMFIGGSPGGTAGGVKTTTFVMLFIFAWSIITNSPRINIFKKEIPKLNFMKAYVVVLMFFSVMFIAILILSITESLPFLSIVFETVSATGTVGLSTGITPLLSGIGKTVIIVLMFIGRVGPITILLSLFRIKSKNKSSEISYPHGEILIG